MTSEATQKKTSCFHCGDECSTTEIHFDSKAFCCRGCKTVYEILNNHEMVEYYEMEQSPGIKNDEIVFSDFSYLDMPEIAENLLTFSGGGKEQVRLNIPGIHCSSCIWLLENLHQIHPAVLKSEVNFLRKEVSIQYDAQNLSLRQLVELLDSVGYKPMIEMDANRRKKANKRKDLSYIYKLGIAGFSFGNIMLLSFPEYFSEGMYADEEFGSFFGYINLILALPVFLYCSSGYFKSAWKGIKHKYLNIDVPISLGIAVLFFRSSFEVISGTGAGYFDSMTGLVFFLLVGRWFQDRTYQALSFERNYKSYFPLGATRIKGSEEENVLLKDIELGDELLIHHGEIIPADSELLSEEAHLDYSFVTGESDPVRVSKGEKLFAGGRQEGEKIRIKVEKKFSQSYLMQLWKQEEKDEEDNKDLSRLIDRVSQYFTGIILSIAFGAAIYWWINDPSLVYHAFTSVLIIACPCALALTIPFTYGNGLRILEKAGIYLRDAHYIEVMSQIKRVVFDKTGTITTGRNKEVHYEGDALKTDEERAVYSVVKNSTHPLSRILSEHFDLHEEVELMEYQEVPGHGIRAKAGTMDIMLGSESFTGMKSQLAGTPVCIKINGKEKGVFAIANEYREGLGKVVSDLKKDKEVFVITGDGIGEEKNLKKYFGARSKLKFKMDPFDKKKFIEELKKKEFGVMMIGDGLNDAGAIKSSDVGLSISDNIYGFLPSCDAIMESSSFEKIPALLKYSRSLRRLVLIGFGISFAYNFIGLFFAIQGVLSPVVAAILMPLSSISVVSFAIFSSNLAARKGKIF